MTIWSNVFISDDSCKSYLITQDLFCSVFVNVLQVEDEFADGYYDDFEDEHEYDTPTGEPTSTPLDESAEHYQKPRSPPCVISKYDTPHTTIETHSEEKTIFMDFAVSTQFKHAVTGPPLNTPSYNNPLASVPTVENLSTFYDTPGATGNIIML